MGINRWGVAFFDQASVFEWIAQPFDERVTLRAAVGSAVPVLERKTPLPTECDDAVRSALNTTQR